MGSNEVKCDLIKEITDNISVLKKRQNLNVKVKLEL